ncbi:uncharacterized protein LACBIDRAFT_328359 [Laccaria bicolor S238N-H82]|uniref:Predicted protein n=1 Tax=Laccaria bicolor (strain S238N-H82 / ATCC MYA-4686) TaxID=486041 RepID=B0DEM7_LACBS|nr:uncharacterized protein LACBIDRAFT_328359 [Laccaria bicolor S238N-H82]EDR06963.1 predicted protein [Laccaria bicolor S238N-H82]|eukprot:XP_001882336.1 predicted protein [Laccaria bicolor S238N-H82]
MFILPENDKLHGYENYPAWKILMGINGRPRGLHKYWENKVVVPVGLDGPIPTSDPTTVIEKPIDISATTPIATQTSEKSTPLLSTTPTLLKYELHENVALSSVRHQGTCRMSEGAVVAGAGGHIEKMRTLRKLANNTSANINNEHFITKLLNSFPESWDAVINSMYSEKDLNTVIMNLTTHVERLSIREGKSKDPDMPMPPSIDTVKALEATILALQAEMKTFRPFQHQCGTTNPSKAHLICANSLCGKVGHLMEDCFGPGGGKAGQYPPWYKGKRATASANLTTSTTSSTSSGSTTPGTHWALSVTFNYQEIDTLICENAETDQTASTENRFILPGAVTNNIKRLVDENTAVERKIALAAAANPEAIGISSACVADSGCTTYFFKSRNVFSIYKSLDKTIGQSSMVGANFRVLGMGTVEIKVVHENVEHTLVFTNALHAPDVTANLISISRMDLAGWEVIFGKQKARFFMGKREIFGGVLKDGLYTDWAKRMSHHFLDKPKRCRLYIPSLGMNK